MRKIFLKCFAEPSCKDYGLCKILTLGQKLKFQKTSQNPFYKSFRVDLCKKTARNKIKYPRNKPILKIGHHAKATGFAKSSLWVKNSNSQKTSQNPLYKSFTVVLCKKTARKNSKYPRNETILKIRHHAKAIGSAKSSLRVKNQNFKEQFKIHSRNHLQLFCAKNRSKKH